MATKRPNTFGFELIQNGCFYPYMWYWVWEWVKCDGTFIVLEIPGIKEFGWINCEMTAALCDGVAMLGCGWWASSMGCGAMGMVMWAVVGVIPGRWVEPGKTNWDEVGGVKWDEVGCDWLTRTEVGCDWLIKEEGGGAMWEDIIDWWEAGSIVLISSPDWLSSVSIVTVPPADRSG